MFSEVINYTPMVGGIAETVFGNVVGDGYNGDKSFVSTARMALYGRTGNDTVNISVKYSPRSASRFRDDSCENDIDYFAGFAIGDMSADFTGRLSIIYSDKSLEESGKIIEFIDKHFLNIYHGWEKIQKVTDLFRGSDNGGFKCLCYVNPTIRSTFLFVDRMSTRVFHLLQSGIQAYFPWYLSLKRGDPETADIVELIYSLREKTPDKYMACLRKFVEKMDLRTENIRRSLDGFETRGLKLRLESERAEVIEIMERINSLYDQIADLNVQKFERDIRVIGLESKISDASADNEIMDYFMSNKSLELLSVVDDSMSFIAKGYMENYDKDALRIIIDNDRSYIYTNRHGAISSNNMVSVMKAIFLDEKLKLRTSAEYRINIRNRAAEGIRYSDNASRLLTTEHYFPNPHIFKYACLGDFRRFMFEALAEYDYIDAIEYCIASSRSLAFNDAAVMREFMNDMYDNPKCIEAPDGTIMNVTEAIAWLKGQEG